MNMQGFYAGTAFDAHEYLGAHLTEGGAVFRTFAPQAKAVSLLLGGREIPMARVYDGNFYEAAVAGAAPGDAYEYRIDSLAGGFADHCDPYGFAMELRPNHRSIVSDLRYDFGDAAWMHRRTSALDKPLNIYELHLGSWRRREDGSWLRYTEIAELLIPHLKESGYNHVEFLPIAKQGATLDLPPFSGVLLKAPKAASFQTS